MPFAASLSTSAETAAALEQACHRLEEQLPTPPDLAVVFFSAHHLPSASLLASAGERLKARALIGCVGEAVIGNDQEIEHNPALCLWAGCWPAGIQVEPFHLSLEDTPDGQSLLGWPDALLGADPKEAALLVLGDPHTFPVDFFLKKVNRENDGLR